MSIFTEAPAKEWRIDSGAPTNNSCCVAYCSWVGTNICIKVCMAPVFTSIVYFYDGESYLTTNVCVKHKDLSIAAALDAEEKKALKMELMGQYYGYSNYGLWNTSSSFTVAVDSFKVL